VEALEHGNMSLRVKGRKCAKNYLLGVLACVYAFAVLDLGKLLEKVHESLANA
jgi:hypothetical protein